MSDFRPDYAPNKNPPYHRGVVILALFAILLCFFFWFKG